MKKLLFVFSIALLVGCDSSDAPVHITEDGIDVYREVPINHDENLPDIDRLFTETEECLGMTAEVPIIKIVEHTKPYCGFNAQSGYCNGIVYILSDRTTWEYLYKHEFIHHIMSHNNDPRHIHNKNPADDPQEIWSCQY